MSLTKEQVEHAIEARFQELERLFEQKVHLADPDIQAEVKEIWLDISRFQVLLFNLRSPLK